MTNLQVGVPGLFLWVGVLPLCMRVLLLWMGDTRHENMTILRCVTRDIVEHLHVFGVSLTASPLCTARSDASFRLPNLWTTQNWSILDSLQTVGRFVFDTPTHTDGSGYTQLLAEKATINLMRANQWRARPERAGRRDLLGRQLVEANVSKQCQVIQVASDPRCDQPVGVFDAVKPTHGSQTRAQEDMKHMRVGTVASVCWNTVARQ